jgi:hypothetical protein
LVALIKIGFEKNRVVQRFLAFDHRHDVVFTHDQKILIIDLDFCPAVFAKQDSVSGLEIQRSDISVFK